MGMSFEEQGILNVDDEACIGCGQCADVCFSKMLAVEQGKARRTAGSFMGCIACGHCMAVCPTEAISVSGRNLRGEDRVGLPPAERRATADQLDALLLARRSVRRFTADEVGRDVLDRIVAMVSTAPMGIPPHEVGVVVFHGRDKVQRFAQDACASYKRLAGFLNPLVLAVMRPFAGKAACAILRDFVRPLLQLIPASRAEGSDAFTYDAPAAMLFHHTPQGDKADAAIAATYAMLAAESLGLGACLLGTTEALGHDKKFKAKYGIPAENKIGLGLVLGQRAVEFRRALRRRLASVEYA